MDADGAVAAVGDDMASMMATMGLPTSFGETAAAEDAVAAAQRASSLQPRALRPYRPASAAARRARPVLPPAAAGQPGQRVWFGADYYPEQWPAATWAQDVDLMKAAGVNVVRVGTFCWGRLEPSEGVYNFDWLDQVLDMLLQAEIAVILATPTAAPPPWFGQRYPDGLAHSATGLRLQHGTRQQFSPHSADFQRCTAAVARALGQRYGSHAALVGWHISNEYGVNSLGGLCYGPAAGPAWRQWLQRRYQTLDRLNECWGGEFWGQVCCLPPASLPLCRALRCARVVPSRSR